MKTDLVGHQIQQLTAAAGVDPALLAGPEVEPAPLGSHPDLTGRLVAVDDHLRPVLEFEGDDIAGTGHFQIHVGRFGRRFDTFGEGVQDDVHPLRKAVSAHARVLFPVVTGPAIAKPGVDESCVLPF